MPEDETATEFEDYMFGGCPICGECVVMNVYKNNWGACPTHHVCWLFGINLLSSWRDEPEEVWEANARELAEYTFVRPITWERDRHCVASPLACFGPQDDDELR